MDQSVSDPANIQTRQALELDACMHCGTCTAHCSVAVAFEHRGNVNILPSEKLQSVKRVVSGRKVDEKEIRLILEGTYWCTNCHRCTEVCPAGINLEELWFSTREYLFENDSPELSVLSPLSFYRGLMRGRIAEDAYRRPLDRAREALAAGCELLSDQSKSINLTPEGEVQGPLLLSDQAASFRACFGCQTCTNVCPVVAAYENPKEALGMLPHQIMYAVGLGIKDLAFGSSMLWHCTTCYQCQEHCPQGVKVTEVLYELKNLAVRTLGEKSNQL
jgi:heterodisulfide reductase subunit C